MSTGLVLQTRHALGIKLSQFLVDESLAGDDILADIRESLVDTGEDNAEESFESILVTLAWRGFNTGLGLTVSSPNEITNPLERSLSLSLFIFSVVMLLRVSSVDWVMTRGGLASIIALSVAS